MSKRKNKTETLTIREGILYHEDGTPVTAGNADAPYRDAYRALFMERGSWPPDGPYTYDGKVMEPA